MITKAKLVKKISAKDTMMQMNVGDTIIIPFRAVNTGTIKTAATRAKQRGEGEFFVSVKELDGKTHVTRLK